MQSDRYEIHSIISLIYETASDPDQWPDLLEALAGFIEAREPPQPSEGSKQAINPPNGQKISTENRTISLADTLKNISTIDVQHLERGTSGALSVASEFDRIFLNHFNSALKVAQRLVEYEEHQEIISTLLDRLPVALVIVDADARIIECNTLAQEIIRSSDGLCVSDGKLCADNDDDTLQLRAFIQRFSRHASSSEQQDSHVLPRTHSGDELLIYATALKPGFSSEFLRLALFISWPKSQPLPLSNALAERYDLTDAERQVTSMLARGFGAKEISQERNVSENTTRSQIKRIMEKTKTRRQAELVKLVLSGPGSLVDEMQKDYFLGQLPGHQLVKYDKAGGKCTVKTVRLADNRRLAYQEWGDPEGIPFIYCHSVLGCRLEGMQVAGKAIEQYNLRLIAPDRPGFGQSDYDPERSMLSWAEDLEKLVDSLGLKQFHIAGYAMGGIYACAAAHRMKNRTMSLMLISSGVTATSKEDFSGMIPLYRLSNKLARDIPKVYQLFASLMRKSTLKNPDRFFDQLASQLPKSEALLFESSDFRTRFYESLLEGWNQGAQPGVREMELLMRYPWGFDPAEIQAPTTLWSGADDQCVPCVLAQKLHRQIPDSKLRVVPGFGHFMIYRYFSSMIDEALLAS